MDFEETNHHIFDDCSRRMSGLLLTPNLCAQLNICPILELIYYAAGVLAVGDEIEEDRKMCPVVDHMGEDNCETVNHFWRGVVDHAGRISMMTNKQTEERKYIYPIFVLRGSQLLLSRMYDFLSDRLEKNELKELLKQINSEQGFLRATGGTAQKISVALYRDAHVGRWKDLSEEIAAWSGTRRTKADDEVWLAKMLPTVR